MSGIPAPAQDEGDAFGSIVGDAGCPTSEAERIAQDDKRRSEADATGAAQIVLQSIVEDFRAGAFSRDDAVRRCVRALQADNIPIHICLRWLGEATWAIHESPEPTRGRGRPERPGLDRLCADLVEIVRLRENLPLTVDSVTKNAFERTLEILKLRGIDGVDSPEAVKNARKRHRERIGNA